MNQHVDFDVNIDEALYKIEELKAILEAMKEEEINDKERMRREAFINIMNKLVEKDKE